MAERNLSLALEVYRTRTWMMHPECFESYRGMVEMSRLHPEMENEYLKLPRLLIYNPNKSKPEERLISTDYSPSLDWWYDLTEFDQVIHLMPITGPILHGNAPCTFGTLELADELRYADEHPSVVGHLVILDTPGGACDANDLNEAFKKAKKPVVAIIRGMNCSKGVWISSFIPHVYAERPDVEIGCIGAMWAISGRKNGQIKDDENYVYYQAYSENSIHKNGEYREAVENGNLKPAIELLNKLDSEFRSVVKNRWPDCPDDKLTGKVYKAEEVIGQMVDGIKSYEECVEMIFELAGVQRISKGVVTPLGTRDAAPDNSTAASAVAYQFDGEAPLAAKIIAQTHLNTKYMDVTALENILGSGTVALDAEGNPLLTADQLNKLKEHFEQSQQAQSSAGSVIASQQNSIQSLQNTVSQSQTEIDRLKAQLAEKESLIQEMSEATSRGIAQRPQAQDNGAQREGAKEQFQSITKAGRADALNVEAMYQHLKATGLC